MSDVYSILTISIIYLTTEKKDDVQSNVGQDFRLTQKHRLMD